MEKQTPKIQEQPAPAKEDKLDKLADCIAGLTQIIAKRELQALQQLPEPAKTVEVVKVYDDEYDATKNHYTQKPKTVGELKEMARNALLQERAEFLQDIIMKDAMKIYRKYGDNECHYDEYAFIRTYESAGPIFKKIYAEEYNKLMRCDYTGVLNDYLLSNKELTDYVSKTGNEIVPSLMTIELEHHARQLIHKNRIA